MLSSLFKKKDVSTDIVEINPNVANVLALSILEDSKNTCMVGQTYRTISYVRDYDPMVDINWGDVLFNRKGSMTTFVCRPSDPARLRSSIDHSDARQGMVCVLEQFDTPGGRIDLVDEGDDPLILHPGIDLWWEVDRR